MAKREETDVLVVGTYERFVIGYEFGKTSSGAGTSERTSTKKNGEKNTIGNGDILKEQAGEANGGGSRLRRRFCLAAHFGPVRCVSGSSLPAPRMSNIVVSGGADDMIRVIDVYAMKDRGTLVKHEVRDKAFPCIALHICDYHSHWRFFVCVDQLKP